MFENAYMSFTGAIQWSYGDNPCTCIFWPCVASPVCHKAFMFAYIRIIWISYVYEEISHLEYLTKSCQTPYISYTLGNKIFDLTNYCQTSYISYTFGNKIVDHPDVVGSGCPNYIFILVLTPGFNRLGKDNCKTRRETFKFPDLVHLTLEFWQYLFYHPSILMTKTVYSWHIGYAICWKATAYYEKSNDFWTF